MCTGHNGTGFCYRLYVYARKHSYEMKESIGDVFVANHFGIILL